MHRGDRKLVGSDFGVDGQCLGLTDSMWVVEMLIFKHQKTSFVCSRQEDLCVVFLCHAHALDLFEQPRCGWCEADSKSMTFCSF